ncbi:MAG: RNA methyltransferase PUA domain-containing protein, partial [Chloroflexota bacterium]
MAHRFFLPSEFIQGEAVQFTPVQARQLATVLRLRPGEQVTVLDGSGSAFDVSLIMVTAKNARGVVTGSRVAGGEPGVRLTLVQGLLRAPKWETVLQKG